MTAIAGEVEARPARPDGSLLLQKANDLFASTLDERAVLDRLPGLIVPALADWCRVELMDEKGSYELVASTGTDIEGGAVQDIPMNVRGMLVGVIHMGCVDRERHSGEERLELALEVARRAAMAIDNARLYARAESANRAKDVFLATLSHEMKTPLTAILGWTRMLRSDGPTSPFFDEALEAVEQSARVQERLIEDLLDVSRVVAGKLQIDRKRTALHDVIRSAVEIIAPVANQNDVHLRVHENADVVVFADEVRLRQVIWNLLTNAVKFTPAGGFVEIRTERDEKTARVRVRDTGRGIRRDALPHLFEQFHQVTVADRVKHHGLGLGLSIVKHLITAHGGTVAAHSDGEGKGAEFVVSLPLFRNSASVDY
jgi:signal transduction histidine kinase